MNLILGGRREENGNLFLWENLFYLGAIIGEAVYPVFRTFKRENKSGSGYITTNETRPGNPVSPPL